MTTATVIMILFAVAAVSILVIFTAQAREKARIERQRRLTAAEDGYRHIHSILDGLPPQYLNRELRQLLLREAIRRAGVMGELGSTKNIDGLIRADEERLEQLTGETSETAQPVKIESAETAREIKSLLKSLFDLIEKSAKQGQIQSGAAKQYLKHVLFLARKTQADFLSAMARDQHRNGKPRKAIHYLNMAQTELAKVRDHPQAQQMLLRLRDHIKALEEASPDSTEKAVANKQQKQLENQWEAFIEEEEGWKKRADFDD